MIEKVRIIFKNIIKMGPDLNFELFKAKLLERKFRQNERIVPTPEGPLKEYVMTEPKYMRDLIIVSRKGFVVDSRDINYALDLISLANEIFEEVMMDYVEYIQLDVVGIYDLTLLVKDAESIIKGIIRKDVVARLQEEFKKRDLRPVGTVFAYGVPQPPNEFVVINLSVVEVPYAKSNRIKMLINYHGVDTDKGIIFIRDLPKFAERIIKRLSQDTK